METPDEIWADDLLGRRSEAVDLIGYLESVAVRPAFREDGHAHVLAVDARYGEGKSFFLRRFARHMAADSHPVAFVDAWVDDLEDEPLVALAATLQRALEPYTTKHASVRERVASFTQKAGKVGAIIATGLAKRGLGLIITQGAVEALGDTLEHGAETAKDANQDAAKELGKAMVDDAEKALAKVTTPSMEARIARFREGQDAVAQMKASLSAVVESLADLGIKTPVTIVIDELDRCRPTYAIKLLEEVKHLFDVPGVAFVLGLHADQLSHSVAAAYGTNFDAQSYLRRFFSRRYSLAPARLDRLIAVLISALSLPTDRMAYPMVRRPEAYKAETLAPQAFISDIMLAYGLSARDAFGLMESLQTAFALTDNSALVMVYLVPLLCVDIANAPSFSHFERELPWNLAFSLHGWNEQVEEVSLESLLKNIDAALKLTPDDLMRAYNKERSSWGEKITWENHSGNINPYAQMRNYPKLIRILKRFTSAGDR